MGKAILAAAPGVASLRALEENIAPVEQALAKICPGRQVFRAFTSEKLIANLRRQSGFQVDNITRALERIEAYGAAQVTVQSLHITPGIEYGNMLAQLEPFRRRLPIFVGKPLLDQAASCPEVARALLSCAPAREKDEALVFVCHGTPFAGFPFSAQLEAAWKGEGERACVAALKGQPNFPTLLEKLKAWPEVKKVCLLPLMLAAGIHARQDMAGEKNSLRFGLEQAGYETRCVLQGLGQCPEIQEIWGKRCNAAIEWQ